MWMQLRWRTDKKHSIFYRSDDAQVSPPIISIQCERITPFETDPAFQFKVTSQSKELCNCRIRSLTIPTERRDRQPQKLTSSSLILYTVDPRSPLNILQPYTELHWRGQCCFIPLTPVFCRHLQQQRVFQLNFPLLGTRVVHNYK